MLQILLAACGLEEQIEDEGAGHHPLEDSVTVRPFFYFSQKSTLPFSVLKRFVQ
jgi:hypothetical protein